MLAFKINIFADYPDIVSVGLIPMIIAIFALGFPLLIQTVTRIDDKYNSTILIEFFKKEKTTKYFIATLLIALFSCALWFTKIPPAVNCGWLINNSALLFLLISTVALICMTFLVVHLIYIYFVPNLLLEHFIKKHRKIKKNITYYPAISKILNYSIQTVDEPLAKKVWSFYFQEFQDIRKGKQGEEIIYPDELYNTFIEANEILCANNKKAISIFNDNIIFDLFFDNYQKTIISKDTYTFLWKLLLQCIYYNRNDFVLSYWRKAHQLFSLFMRKIRPKYNSCTSPVTNQTEIDEKEIERSDF